MAISDKLKGPNLFSQRALRPKIPHSGVDPDQYPPRTASDNEAWLPSWWAIMSNSSVQREYQIAVDRGSLPSILRLPDGARGIVIFAHGSGSSRLSERNQMVARRLEQAGLGTLLFDLLEEREAEQDAHSRAYRFDIPLLSRRLTGVVDWVAAHPQLPPLNIGLFGASTGAAAALVTAAARPQRIDAVVSRGGRPDLAADALPEVRVPVLLIVGGRDTEVLQLNQWAAEQLQAPNEITIVSGASHLFEEAGALARVADLAAEWFRKYLAPGT